MLNILFAVLMAIPLTFVSCQARAEDHRVGPVNGPNVTIQTDREHVFPRHIEVHRHHFHSYRHGRTEFGVVIAAPWVPGPGYAARSAWCPDPAGYYPDVQVCFQPWVRVIN